MDRVDQLPAQLNVTIRIRERGVFALSAMLALLLFLSTLQWGINGSEHRYATDVGEIQNALPRWGTIHFTGYPQYTALGSLFVNGLRLVGLPPAAGASLFSAVWGAIAAGLLALLIFSFRTAATSAGAAVVAVLASLLFAMSTSMWVDGSIAELHTMTMALTFAALLMGVRFQRTRAVADLYWLVFLSSQGITHQRAFAFLAPALALLVWPHRRLVLQKWLPVLALTLTGPITYLYLPLVDWLGSGWVFSAPGTWQGFWALALDTKAERIVSLPGSGQEFMARARSVAALLNDDWPAPLWITGLLGLTFARRQTDLLERAALTATWVGALLLSFVIWEGFVSDALLAVKLPIIAMSAVGLGFIAVALSQRSQTLGVAALACGLLVGGYLFASRYPRVVAITRDDSAAQTIGVAAQITSPEDGRAVTFMALWGNDFWQLAYAQAYEGRLSRLNLVDHNANFAEILGGGDRLYTFSRTFLTRPPDAWEQRLGDLQLSSVAPGVVEMRRKGDIPMAEDGPSSSNALLRLDNGVSIQEATLTRQPGEALLLTVQWRADSQIEQDYSVAVHLVSQDPPLGPEHVVAQADRAHPVDGWYPTSQWEPGEVISDHYLLEAPPGAEAVAVRLAMYRLLENGEFQNTEALSLPLP